MGQTDELRERVFDFDIFVLIEEIGIKKAT